MQAAVFKGKILQMTTDKNFLQPTDPTDFFSVYRNIHKFFRPNKT